MSLLSIETNIAHIITTTFNGIDASIIGVLGPITDVALVIAGIACIVMIAKQVLPAIERSEKIDIYPLLRPILIAILVLNFNTLVVGTLNGILDIINDEVKEVFDAGDGGASNFHSMADNKRKEIASTYKSSESRGVFLDTIDKITNYPKYVSVYIKYDLFFPGLYHISTFLGMLLYLGLMLVSRFYLVVLTIVGPLTLAFSQYDFFQGSMGSWLGKYISVGLWPALANILRYMLNEISALMGQGVGTGWDEGLVMFLLIIGLSFLYFQIPQISEFICAAGGMGSLQSGVDKAVGTPRKIATGVAMGGVAVAAGAAVAYKEGVFNKKGSEKLHGLATSYSDRTGARGMFSRAGERLGSWVGTKARHWKDDTLATKKGETAEEKAKRIADRVKEKQELWSYRHAPKKKDLRKQAKQVRSQMLRGRYVSPSDAEMVQRYKEGEYKGRGRYRPEPREQDHLQVIKDYLMTGLEKGEAAAGWHPPMARPGSASAGSRGGKKKGARRVK